MMVRATLLIRFAVLFRTKGNVTYIGSLSPLCLWASVTVSVIWRYRSVHKQIVFGI